MNTTKHNERAAKAQATSHESAEHPFDDEGGPLSYVLSRRSALWLVGGGGLFGLATLAGCGGGSSTSPVSSASTTSGTTGTTGTTTGSSAATPVASATATPVATATATPTPVATATPAPVTSGCTLIPTETAGPFPLLTVLSNAGILRQDITEGETGVPLTVVLNLVNVGDSCGPISNAAVYLWHCDKDGLYSGYSQQGGSTTGQTFLRGVQISDGNGQVTFKTIYPGWYGGRITHMHFQVYLGGSASGMATATSQIALPLDVNRTVYASSLYASRGQNTSVTSFAQDNVFSDGTQYQMATVSGSVSAGYTATLTVGVRGS